MLFWSKSKAVRKRIRSYFKSLSRALQGLTHRNMLRLLRFFSLAVEFHRSLRPSEVGLSW